MHFAVLVPRLHLLVPPLIVLYVVVVSKLTTYFPAAMLADLHIF